MKPIIVIAGIMVIMAIKSPSMSQTVGSDMMRKPGNWRGTLLEGTDAVVATSKAGDPLFVDSGDTVAQMFVPAPLTADRLVGEFKKLCIDTAFDQASLASAASSSSFSLSNRRLTIPSPKNRPAYEASIWHSAAARVQIWSGDVINLNGRQTLSRWRNGATSSPFDDGRMLAPACNITVMATGFDGPQPFVTAMNDVLRATPVKSVIKSQWADGHWSIVDAGGQETRIFYSMTDLDRSEHLLHVAIALVPSKQAK